MSESTFPIEFIGGSRDGEVAQATSAPDFHEVIVSGGMKEIYERQNNAPPFIYVQIGYARNETWKG
jgi:ethanolamine utilization protein EutA (predicted chaperonin)